jgi:predicted RNA binding protein YcfA (HicA-like mRNA interferase family)
MVGIWLDRKEVTSNTNMEQKGLVTIAAHKMSDEIAPGTLNSIFKQAQIKNK